MSSQHVRVQPRERKHPRYPTWAIIVGLIALFVAIGNVNQYDYTGMPEAAVIDFALAFVITFLFWYGVVLLVGWVARKVRPAR